MSLERGPSLTYLRASRDASVPPTVVVAGGGCGQCIRGQAFIQTFLPLSPCASSELSLPLSLALSLAERLPLTHLRVFRTSLSLNASSLPRAWPSVALLSLNVREKTIGASCL